MLSSACLPEVQIINNATLVNCLAGFDSRSLKLKSIENEILKEENSNAFSTN